MAKTQIYGLGYLQAFEDVGGSGNLDMDELRFRSIENQQYGIYSLFGNGIRENVDQFGNPIPSWEIQNVAGSSLQVLITPGQGHVAWKYAETTVAAYVDIIPPQGNTGNLVFYLYAIPTNATPYTKAVSFVASTQVITDTVNYVGLGGVIYTIGSDGTVTLTPMNTEEYGRRVISLFGVLSSLINKHKHIGGATNPSPIDLGKHVQGKLSGDYITDLDASKIDKGTLAPERLPLIDHNTLLRRGTLTHPQIDSLLAALVFHSDSRMSDVEITNLLQLGLGLKRTLGMSSGIHKDIINTIFYIPGITLDKFASWHNPNEVTPKFPLDYYGLYTPYVSSTVSLADIDTAHRRIVGINTNAVSNDSIIWDTDIDFAAAAALVSPFQTQVIGIGTTAYITIQKPVKYMGIATTELDQKWSQGYTFKDNSRFLNSAVPPPVKDTFYDDYAVKRYVYYEFASVMDIRGRDNVGIGFGVTNNSVPGAINFFFIVATNGNSQTFVKPDGTPKTIQISKSLEIYSNTSSNGPGYFVYKGVDVFNLTEDQKAHILGIGISYSIDTGWDRLPVSFNLYSPTAGDIVNSGIFDPNRLLTGTNPITDPGRSTDQSAVFVWNQIMYDDQAEFTFRFDSGYNSTVYTNISYDPVVQPVTTEFIVRTRTANTLSDLAASNYYVISGSSPDPASKSGRYIDVQAQFYPSGDRLAAPILDKLSLYFYGPGATQAPKVWDHAHAWQTGQFLNIEIIGDILTDQHQPVAAAAVGDVLALPNPALTAGQLIVDGYTVQPGDRLLLPSQTGIGTTNGIYIYSGSGTGNTLTRTSDMNDGVSFTNNIFFTSLHGTTWGGKTFRTTTSGTVGINAILFSQYTNALQMQDTSLIGRFIYVRDNISYYANRPKNNPITEADEYVYQDGTLLYKTPRQIFEKLSQGYYGPRDLHTLPNTNVVVVDTENDRVVEVDSTGALVKAVQGNLCLRETDRDFVICTATYNPRLGQLWLAFSQNAFLLDKSKISLSGGSNQFSFDATDPNNVNMVVNVQPFNPIPSTDTISSTWVATLPAYFMNLVATWSRPLTLSIAVGAFRCKGKSTNSYRDTSSSGSGTGSGSGTFPGGSGSGSGSGGGGGGFTGGGFFPLSSGGGSLPPYVTGPPPNYIVPQTGTYDGVFDATGQSLPPASTGTSSGGDFNGDGKIDNADSDSTPLLGPNGLAGTLTLTVIEGNIVFDNVYNPLSVHVTSDDNWVVAAVGDRGVISYDTLLLRDWTISSTYVDFRTDVNGHAYEMDSGYILVALPAPGIASASAINKGYISVLNRFANGNPALAQMYVDGDAVRAFPNNTDTEFWVCVDDRLNNSKGSGIVRVDYSGNVTWKFGQNQILMPNGFRILYNGDLLVSE